MRRRTGSACKQKQQNNGFHQRDLALAMARLPARPATPRTRPTVPGMRLMIAAPTFTDGLDPTVTLLANSADLSRRPRPLIKWTFNPKVGPGYRDVISGNKRPTPNSPTVSTVVSPAAKSIPGSRGANSGLGRTNF